MEEPPPTVKNDLKTARKPVKYDLPEKGTLQALILDELNGRKLTDKMLTKRIRGFPASSIRTRRHELVEKGLVTDVGLDTKSGSRIWTMLSPSAIQANRNNEKARSARPVEKNVTINETPKQGKQVVLKLQHCGEILIRSEDIVGWFHPIPLKLWAMIVGFHHSISRTYKAESVSYHRWNPKLARYDSIIPFQVTSSPGLSVSTDWENPKNVEILNYYSKVHGCEFFPANTIHTHVDASAFESSTDAGDEEDLPGWHITIGRLLTHENLDLDCRFRLPKLPKIRSLTSVERSYEIMAKHLFKRGTDPRAITQVPRDNNHLQRYFNRVRIR